jgi:trans-aconitate methyltransferase
MLFVDSSPEMIKEVQQKIERGQIENAAVLCADFLTDPPDAPMADCIITAQVLLHIPDTALVLKRLYDALYEGGRLIAVDFDKNDAVPSDRVHNGFDQNELIDMAKQAGFANATAHTFYSGEKLFMGQDASMFLLNAQK